MSSVFHGAYMTIAASGSHDANGGLFIDDLEPPLVVDYTKDDEPRALVRCPAFDVEYLHEAPINSRAWILQDLVLSRRTVHFAKDQIYWQCQSLMMSEDGLIQNNTFESMRFTVFIRTLGFF